MRLNLISVQMGESRGGAHWEVLRLAVTSIIEHDVGVSTGPVTLVYNSVVSRAVRPMHLAHSIISIESIHFICNVHSKCIAIILYI